MATTYYLYNWHKHAYITAIDTAAPTLKHRYYSQYLAAVNSFCYIWILVYFFATHYSLTLTNSRVKLHTQNPLARHTCHWQQRFCMRVITQQAGSKQPYLANLSSTLLLCKPTCANAMLTSAAAPT